MWLVYSLVKIPFIDAYRFMVANIPSPHHVADRTEEAHNGMLHLDAGSKANGTPVADTQPYAEGRMSTG